MNSGHYINNLNQGLNSPFRILLFLGTVFLAVYIGFIPLQADNFASLRDTSEIIDFVFLLTPFVFGFLAIAFGIKVFHRLRFKDLIIPFNFRGLNLKRLLFGFSLWLCILGIFEFITYLLDPGNYRIQTLDTQYIYLLIIGLVLIPVQTSFEELLIRSYVTQQFNYHLKNIIISVILASVVFAFMHINNPEMKQYGYMLMFSNYLIAGLFLALLGLKDGRLELSLGVHAANNIFSALIVNYSGSVFRTKTLVEANKINVPLSLTAFVIAATIFYWICKYKYSWNNIITEKNKD